MSTDNPVVPPTPARPVRSFNRPRFMGNISIPPNTAMFEKVVAALGGPDRLIAFIKAFVQDRFDNTGWRSIKDVTSRDSKHAPAQRNVPSTEFLETPFESLTATLAAEVEAKSGEEIKLTRDESLGVLAALAADEKLIAESGVKIWAQLNEALGYITLGLSALPSGQIPDSAREQAARLKY